MVGIEAVEYLADAREGISAVFLLLVGGIAQDVELHVEQLFKLQSEACALQFFGGLRIVYVAQCRVPLHQTQSVGDKRRQCLRQRLVHLFEHRLRDFLYRPRCQSRLLHLLRGDIVGLHSHL